MSPDHWRYRAACPLVSSRTFRTTRLRRRRAALLAAPPAPSPPIRVATSSASRPQQRQQQRLWREVRLRWLPHLALAVSTAPRHATVASTAHRRAAAAAVAAAVSRHPKLRPRDPCHRHLGWKRMARSARLPPLSCLRRHLRRSSTSQGNAAKLWDSRLLVAEAAPETETLVISPLLARR